MRWRFETTNRKRCAVGKRLAMRCRFATTLLRKNLRSGSIPPQGPEVQAQKKIKQTDVIFTRLHDLHAQAGEADNVLRLSLDTKATVKIGLFSREGDNWVELKALVHDFKPDAILSPFGIL